MPPARPRRLVIDADVARACARPDEAKGLPSPSPSLASQLRRGRCWALLEHIRRLCHHVVTTPEIADEWDRHRSRFFVEWRTSMRARRKVVKIPSPADARLRERVLGAAPDETAREAMRKDLHLIEAALTTDRVIVSLDEKAADLFAGVSRQIGELRAVAWVNAERGDPEQLRVWLDAGAEAKEEYTLGHRVGPQ